MPAQTPSKSQSIGARLDAVIDGAIAAERIVGAFPLVPLALLALAFVVTLRARRRGFPPARRP